MKKKNFFKLISLLIVFFQLLSLSNDCYANNIAQKIISSYKNADDNLIFDTGIFDQNKNYYSVFQNYKNKNIKFPKNEIKLQGNQAEFNEKDAKIVENYNSNLQALVWQVKGATVKWTFDVPEEGLYNISLNYMPVPGFSGDIDLQLKINGEYPFNEAQNLSIYRLWKDAGDIKKDNRGNELRPDQVEVPNWQEYILSDHEGLNDGEYYFYFNKGKNTIELSADRDLLALQNIKVFQYTVPDSYEAVLKKYQQSGYIMSQDVFFKVQAEDTYQKSSQLLHPIYDRGSNNEPSDPSKIRLNIVGGNTWKYIGQWMSWKIEVPEDGLYNIGMRCRQNINFGFPSIRKIYVDGVVPFEELQNFAIDYNNNWQIKMLGESNEDPYLVYLKKGTHEIKMEVVLGDMSDILRMTQDVVLDLNNIYRSIIMVTSTKPDVYRDYFLEKAIPDLIGNLESADKKLASIHEKFDNMTVGNKSAVSIIDQIDYQLKLFMKDTDKIATDLDSFKSNVSSLAAWLLKLKEQPLEIDYLFVASPKYKKIPKADSNIFEKIWFETRSYVASYFEDYSSIGNVYTDSSKEPLKIWISTGRDQAQTLKTLIDNDFVSKTGISVNLSLVQGSLVQAILAGKGPDVALNVSRGEPVNLAMRNALVDLSKYPDYKEVITRFHPEIMTPYKYQEGYYALPEVQDYYMMFYRKDIFGALGIKPPQKWEDVYDCIAKLQKKNLEFGIPYQTMDAYQAVGMGIGINNILPTLMLQNGVSLYKDKLDGVNFDNEDTINVFTQWSNYYNDFDLPLIYDFYNRFRTGEMPIGIQRYTFYNMLSVAAPEIKNLWDMVPIPGTIKSDGSIDRTSCSTGHSAIIIENEKRNNQDESWEFLKWWTSADVQTQFGRELEALMGPAARYNSANIEAFMNIPWKTNELNNLLYQWSNLKEIPEVPGGYYTSRNIDNAFRSVIFDKEVPREALMYYQAIIDDEIIRKRKEFGLED